MKEAYLYEKLEDKKVRCEVCWHRCVIKNGGKGICMVKENKEGILYSLVYARPISIAVDPIEKKPFFHFLPGSKSLSIATVGCNFRCKFCQNWDISQYPLLNKGEIIGEYASPERIVELALKYGTKSISYTYTEPTIFFEYAYDTMKLAKKYGIRNNWVTNGYFTDKTLDFMKDYLDAANVDFKSFKDEFYIKYCGARAEGVKKTLKNLRRYNIWFEVTTLIIPGLNDTDEELKDIAKFIRDELGDFTPWHINRFYPHYKMDYIPPTPLETLLKAREIGKSVGLKYIYIGNVWEEGLEDTYCPKCGALLVKRKGFWVEINNIIDGRCKFCGFEIKGVFK